MVEAKAHPHLQLMERAWQNCRRGVALCQEDPEARQRALNFVERAHPVAPAIMQRWRDILNGGFREQVATLLNTFHFRDLTSAEQAWWDQLLQSAPFAPVLHPRDAERRKNIRASDFKRGAHMTLEQFNHVCRAAAAVAAVTRVYVFGANAIIPWLHDKGVPAPLAGFVPSRELDISAGDEKLDTLIDGAIGESSMFDQTFLVYAHGLSLEGFRAPKHWRMRARHHREPVSATEVIVPHPHDIIMSKLVAGREKDFDFARAAVRVFPLDEATQSRLLLEFREAHPQEAETLQRNLEVFQSRS